MSSGIGLIIKIAADSKKAVGDIKDVNQALGGTGTAASGATNLIKGMKGPALAALGAVAGAALAAGAAMVEFGKAAWEDHQEAEKLARTLKTIPGITQDMIDANEDWITQTMFATHVMDTDLRQAVSDLALVTGDLALAQEYAVAAADLATVADVEYEAAVAAVEKALAGKTTSLMKMAPWLDTNKDGTLSAAEAQAVLTSETLKGQAAAAAAEDPWTTIQIIFDEIKEALGAWLIPLFKDLGAWFADPVNQKKIQEFINQVGELSYQIGQKLVPYLEQLFTWLGSPEGQRAIKDMIQLVGALAKAFLFVVDAVARLYDMLKRFWDANLINKIPWDKIPGVNASGPAAAAMPSGLSAGPAQLTRTTGVVINFNGVVGDQEGTARAIHGVLRGSDRRTARSASSRAGEARW